MFTILILTAHNVSGKLKNTGNSSETFSYLSLLFIAVRSIFPAHNQGVWIHTLSNDRDDYKGEKGPNICLTNITLGRKFKLTFPSCITFIVVLSCHLHRVSLNSFTMPYRQKQGNNLFIRRVFFVWIIGLRPACSIYRLLHVKSLISFLFTSF